MKISERVKMGGRGQGSLFKQDGSANWFSRYYARGVEHIESTGTSDLKAAKRIHKGKLDELAADRQGLKPYISPESKRVTVGELLDDLDADYRLRGVKSLPQCLSHGKHIREAFGRWRAVEITPEKIDAYCERRLAAGATSATVNRETQILAHAFRLAVDRGKVATMPKIRRLAERNVRKGFFEAHEFTTVVNALPEYLQDAARFAYLTGWRRSEILGLTWSDVDLTGGVIRLYDTKNGHGRALAVAGDLRALMTRREQARLLTTTTGDVRVVDLVFHHHGKPIVDYRKGLGDRLPRRRVRLPRGQPDDRAERTGPQTPRPSTDGRAQHGAAGDAGARRHGRHRASDPQHVRPLQHRQRGRLARGDGTGDVAGGGCIRDRTRVESG